MPDFDIRHMPMSEAMPLSHTIRSYAFRGDHPPLPDPEKAAWVAAARPDAVALIGFLDEEPLITAFYSPMVQNICGVMRASSAVWGVASHPKARRQGYVRQTMQHLFRQSAEAFPFSALYPFRPSFYGRLGYAPYPEQVTFSVPTEQLRPALRMELPGTVEQTLLSESYARFLHFAEGVQQGRHGMGLFAHADVRNLTQRRDRYAVYALDALGKMVGAMAYRIEEDSTLRVWPFLSVTPLGRALLLAWLARHIDQCPRTLIMEQPPLTKPNTWLPDLLPSYERHIFSNAPMGRVVNLSGLVRLPVGEGDITVRIHDSHAPWNEGVFRLYSADGELYLDGADAPTCDLTIHALSALAVGSHDPAAFEVLGWGNPDSAAQAQLRALFPRAWPSLFEVF